MRNSLHRIKKRFFIQQKKSFNAFESINFLKEVSADLYTFSSLRNLDLSSLQSLENKIILKHDLHHTLDNITEIGKYEQSLGIQSVIFSPGSHPIARDWTATPAHYKVLANLQEMDHEIGFHADFLFLIEKYGDLQRGLDVEISGLRKAGFNIQNISRHGNTNFSKALRSNNTGWLFKESEIRGSDLKEIEKTNFQPYLWKYDWGKLLCNLGLTCSADRLLYLQGMKSDSDYLTDNSGNWKFFSTDEKQNSLSIESDIFFPDDIFRIKVGQRLQGRNVLVLMHPQWQKVK